MAGFFITRAERGTLQAVASDQCFKTHALRQLGRHTPKEAPTAAGSAPKDVLQALSTHLAEGSVLGAKSWLR